MTQVNDNRISYIKKPIAAHSYTCLIAAAVGLVLFLAGMGLAVRSQGEVALGVAAVCFSSLLFSACGVRYGYLSFKEKEKNYILAKLGTVLSGILVILWFVMMLIGVRG